MQRLLSIAASAIANPAIGELVAGVGTVTPTGFTAAGAGQTIAWNSSVPGKASINAATGVITPIAAGDTTISYQVTDDTNHHIIAKGSAAVTVQTAAADLSEGMFFVDGSAIGTTKETNSFSNTYKYVIAPAGSITRPAVDSSTAAYTGTLTWATDITIAEGGANHLFMIELDGDSSLKGWAEITIPDGAIADDPASQAHISTPTATIAIGVVDPTVVVTLTGPTLFTSRC